MAKKTEKRKEKTLAYTVRKDQEGSKELWWVFLGMPKPSLADVLKAVHKEFSDTPLEKLELDGSMDTVVVREMKHRELDKAEQDLLQTMFKHASRGYFDW